MAVRQFFRADFVHAVRTEEPEPEPKSGEPGYIKGKPMLAGTLEEEEGENKKKKLKVLSHGLSSWQPTSSSLCRDSGREPVAFGVDLRSGCLLQLSRRNFSNCSELAESVLNIQGWERHPDRFRLFLF